MSASNEWLDDGGPSAILPFIRCQSGDLVNMAMVTSLQVVPDGKKWAAHAHFFGEDDFTTLAVVETEEIARGVVDRLARMLPITVVDVDLDVIASLEHEKEACSR